MRKIYCLFKLIVLKIIGKRSKPEFFACHINSVRSVNARHLQSFKISRRRKQFYFFHTVPFFQQKFLFIKQNQIDYKVSDFLRLINIPSPIGKRAVSIPASDIISLRNAFILLTIVIFLLFTSDFSLTMP